MFRGNGGEAIFWNDRDRELFQDTLDEAYGRCGWRIHAFVLMGNHQWQDGASGRRNYREYMQSRVLEISGCENPAEYDAGWDRIRRGWYLGDETFRKSLMERMDDVVAGKQRDSFSGEQVTGHDEVEAERLVRLGMEILGLADEALGGMKKNCADKYAIAWLVRRNT